MSNNCREIEENFETLEDLFTTMSRGIKQLEQQQSQLENSNKRLNDTNNMLLEITKKQRTMASTSEQSTGLSPQDITNNYRVSLYKKLAELEQQLLVNQTSITEDLDLDNKDGKQMYRLQLQIYSLLEENKSLKEQLAEFQILHDRVMAEIRSSDANNSNQLQENNAMCTTTTSTDALDENDLQPLQVNVIDSDLDEGQDINMPTM